VYNCALTASRAALAFEAVCPAIPYFHVHYNCALTASRAALAFEAVCPAIPYFHVHSSKLLEVLAIPAC
jgi:hypothetical protein